MFVQRIAAFSQDGRGGNPAGVVIGAHLPREADMQATAREVGYSETAFAAPVGDGWRVRYFAPAAEVPFCGHATIALGVVLGQAHGAGQYRLQLNDSTISVEASLQDGVWRAALQSPPTRSWPMAADLLDGICAVFDLTHDMLDPQFGPRLAFAGAYHGVVALAERDVLAAMAYDFEAGRALMARHDLTTVSLVYFQNPTTCVARNAFAAGGVVEDPATGAAAAALGGALVDVDWPALRGGGHFTIYQGADMGMPSVLQVQVTGLAGDSVRVSGAARNI